MRRICRIISGAFFVGILTMVAVGCGSEGDGTTSAVDPTLDAGQSGPAEPILGYPPAAPPSLSLGEDAQNNPATPAPGLEPVIEELIPPLGHTDGGDVVSIRGTHFQPGADVYFGETLVANPFYINDEFINVTTPPGDPGPIDVRIVNPDGGAGELVDGFLYEGDLELHSVSPVEGTALGGTQLTITGKGFQDGVRVWVGDFEAFEVTVQDGQTLTCRTPVGALGTVSVRARGPEDSLALLPNAYRYRSAPSVETLWPIHGPTAGDTEVELKGRFFQPEMVVLFGETAAELVSVSDNGTQATVLTPHSLAGVVDVSATTDDGVHSLPQSFTFLAPEQMDFSLWAVSPIEGSASGGNEAVLVVTGILPMLPVTVAFGANEASVTGLSLYPNTVFVTVPSGVVGSVTVTVTQGEQMASLVEGYLYTEPLAVDAVDPNFGLASGGTIVHILGEGFSSSPNEDARIGALSLQNFEVVSDTEIIGVSPPCTPGLQDVLVDAGDRTATLFGGFECRTDGVGLFAVEPATGAQAGGAWLKLIGDGLPTDSNTTVVTFNGEEATDYQWVGPNTAWVRTPRGEVGVAVIEIQSPEWGEGPVVLSGAFSYFDPANKKAAVAGPPIEMTVNVTVFNGETGKPLAGALAILGTDPNTNKQCVTDDRGQCVISEFGVRGKQQISVGKSIYSAYTFLGFDGSNVNVFLRPQEPPGYDGPPGSPGAVPPVDWDELTGYITGNVTGVGKYVVVPPGDCALVGSPDGSQCTPCSESDPCASPMECQPIANTGSWCVKPCETDDDCASGFGCVLMGDGPKCVPKAGTVSANCATSRRYFLSSNPDPGPNGTVTLEDSEFTIQSRLGEVTVYCVGGYTSANSGEFIPTIMGIRENVYVIKDQVTGPIEVPLTIPLTRDLRLRVHDLPTDVGGVSTPTLNVALDIGASGWIPFNKEPTLKDGEFWYVQGYPESFAAFPEDSLLSVYSYVRTLKTGQPILYAYYLNHQLESAGGEPIVEHDMAEDRWSRPIGGVVDDLSGAWGTDLEHVFAVGPNGRVLHKGPFGWGQQPTTTQNDLNAIWGAGPNDVWAVGDAGTILHFNGILWAAVSTQPPITGDLHDVHGGWIVGDDGLFRITDQGVVPVNLSHSAGLRAVHTNGDRAVAVGTNGKVLTYDGDSWQALLMQLGDGLVLPSLTAVWCDVEGWTLVGTTDGRIVRMSADGEYALESTPDGVRDITAIAQDGYGRLIAVGSSGWLLERNASGSGWLDASNEATEGLDGRDIWSHDQGVMIVGAHSVGMGPWMAFVNLNNPSQGKFMQHDHVSMALGEGGAPAQYNLLYLRASDNYRVWNIVTEPSQDWVDLDVLSQALGYDPVVSGMKSYSLYRARALQFSMDGFLYKDLSMWRRKTWSRAYGSFY